MVKLNRIYTKAGDEGMTGLGDGTRVPKHHVRVAAYGTADELSSVLGLLLTEGDLAKEVADRIRNLQNDLFDVGSDLCVPGQHDGKLRITTDYTLRLEHWIDEVNEHLRPLNSFVLPGGQRTAAWLHLARCTCRRAERLVSELLADTTEVPKTNPEILRFLNRLSDLFFVLARDANNHGEDDVLWEPGRTQK